MSEMTPETFLRELGAVREGVHQSVTELKADLRQVVSELRRVSDTMLTIQAQDVAGQLAKLKENEINATARRVTELEQDRIRLWTTIKVLAVVGTAAISVLGIWVQWKH